MKRLLTIEWLKVRNYRTFHVYIGLYILLILAVYAGFDSFKINGPFDLSVAYKFPDVWYYASYVSTWFAAIPALLMINLVCNEISFRTMRQHIIDGMPRLDYLKGKLILSAAISVLTGILVLLTGSLIGSLKGSGTSILDGISDVTYVLRAMWVSFGMMTAAIFIAITVKRSALSILFFLLLYWIIEPIIGNMWLTDIYPYLPFNSLDEFISSPFQLKSISFGKNSTPWNVTLAGIIYPLLFIAGSYQQLTKKDL
jgi:ABC-2 type transport system permease protein